jgi:hypothetical protein
VHRLLNILGSRGMHQGIVGRLGRQSPNQSPAEVSLIELVGFIGPPTELVSPAAGDLAMQPFQIVALFDEFLSEIIQQCRVAGRVGEVHVIRRIDNAHA